jgi:hypothetical protein
MRAFYFQASNPANEISSGKRFSLLSEKQPKKAQWFVFLGKDAIKKMKSLFVT